MIPSQKKKKMKNPLIENSKNKSFPQNPLRPPKQAKKQKKTNPKRKENKKQNKSFLFCVSSVFSPVFFSKCIVL